MNSTLFKSIRNGLLAALLVTGCGGAERIAVDLEHAAGPCEYGQEFMTEGMMMVMKDGHVTVVPREEGQVQAAWTNYTAPKGGNSTQATCEGCH